MMTLLLENGIKIPKVDKQVLEIVGGVYAVPEKITNEEADQVIKEIEGMKIEEEKAES